MIPIVCDISRLIEKFQNDERKYDEREKRQCKFNETACHFQHN